MFGLGMGVSVDSNARLTKARELRAQEEAAHAAGGPGGPRRPNLRVIRGSVPGPWIPTPIKMKKPGA